MLKISDLTTCDSQTQLVTRQFFNLCLERRLSQHCQDLYSALIVISIDNFKLINEKYGYLVGDDLLAEVAARIKNSIRDDDIVSRLAGDEFGVIVRCKMNGVEAIGERLISAIQAPISLNDRVSLQFNVSIGIATLVERHSTIDGVLSEAETALYVTKCSEISKSKVISIDLEDQLKEHNSLQADLRHAVETGYGLSLVYQPIFDLRTGIVTAREALTRWTHPKRGAIPPSIFIPLAEELGLIDALGTWVINNACFQAKERNCDSRIAVNVSCLQLHPGFSDRVLGIVRSNELCPNRLEIEITESALSEDSSNKLKNLKQLKRAGVKIALDDFGGGVSSFGHVRAFPFDRIKIEGSFVRDAISHPDCAVVVGIVANLGKRLDIVTVAKGIETPKHLELVRQHGCDEAQGYFLGRPSPEG